MTGLERPSGAEGSGAPEFGPKSALMPTTGWGPRVIVCFLFDQPSGWRALDWSAGVARAAGSTLIVIGAPQSGYEWLVDSAPCGYASVALCEAADSSRDRIIGEVESVCCDIPHRTYVLGNSSTEGMSMACLDHDSQPDLLVVGASSRWRSRGIRSVSRSLGWRGRVPTLVIP